MAGYILREDQPNIVRPAQQADRLIGRGDGDAALLYLCLLRADRGVTAQELQRKLKWSQLRLHAAETALQELGLIDRPPEQKPPEPAQERIRRITATYRAPDEDARGRLMQALLVMTYAYEAKRYKQAADACFESLKSAATK